LACKILCKILTKTPNYCYFLISNPPHNDDTMTLSLSDPDGYHHSALNVFYETIRETPYAHELDRVLRVIDAPSPAERHTILMGIPANEFDAFIHVFHITMFVHHSLENPTPATDPTPVTHALQTLLNTVPLADALALLPGAITDVLTTHPVDMDRGLVVSHKQDFEQLCQTWEHTKRTYAHVTDTHDTLLIRATLNNTYQQLKHVILLLIYTPNYRQNRIHAESEQRHLSRAIKDHEMAILTHWRKLITVVQVLCLQHVLRTLDDPAYAQYTQLPPIQASYVTLAELPVLNRHALFPTIANLSHTLYYHLETWRGDMDGNPYVNANTVALSLAYGRKRCFERLSADDAVIRYRYNTPAFLRIEAELSDRLSTLETTGDPAWVAYIQDRHAAGWPPVQIYSGLAYYRMVEMTEAAELFSRTPDTPAMLHTGYATDADFLAVTEPLEALEASLGFTHGFWHTQRQLIQLRGLSLGHPHIRHSEYANHTLALELMGMAPTAWAALSEPEQCAQLLHWLDTATPITQIPDGLSPASHALLNNYLGMMAVAPTSRLIQSDSMEYLPSLRASLTLLRLVSVWIGHTGTWVILCENEASMATSIAAMNDPTQRALFHNVIMMCAGSDNQKKLGPFYSAYLNTTFLKTAQANGIDSFFGVGDSPLRSALHTPFCTFKTLQPGSRKHHFFAQRIQQYVSHRLATHIQNCTHYWVSQHRPSPMSDSIFQLLGASMYPPYKAAVQHNTALHAAIQSIASIATTYFSRPATKPASSDSVLTQIRAIDSGRAQLILNTCDPQLAGLSVGIANFLDALATANIETDACYDFFNHTPTGQALLNTLAYFYTILDDRLDTPAAIRTVTQADVQAAYAALSGQTLLGQSDPTLAIVRCIWQCVTNRPDLHEHKANTLLLFGANWMV